MGLFEPNPAPKSVKNKKVTKIEKLKPLKSVPIPIDTSRMMSVLVDLDNSRDDSVKMTDVHIETDNVKKKKVDSKEKKAIVPEINYIED